MSQPSRPRASGPAKRRRQNLRIEAVTRLEDRQLLAPVVSVFPRTATFTADANNPPNQINGTVTVTDDTAQANFASPAPVVSVSQLSSAAAFGGDIVRIEAGPGGDFGRGVYAISRGAGSNTGAINRPGVIYRVDTATGKATVFFDLNTVLSQLEAGGTAANSVGASTGFVNWYDISFDREGYFDGRPSMFVATVDRQDANKNAIYRIAPDGTFLGAFATLSDGQNALRFTSNPTAILVPPVEQQSFLRGLFAGSGTGSASNATTTFSAFFFDANAYRPGQNISSQQLPFGMSQTPLSSGPQTGIISSNTDYISPVYSTFTDFGTPAAGGIPAAPGVSGVQGLNGGQLIGLTVAAPVATALDQLPLVTTQGRRFQDVAFDYYGYFSVGLPVVAGTGGTGSTVSFSSIRGTVASVSNNTPLFGGSLFVSDLATGLAVSVTPPGGTTPVTVPVQGSGRLSVDANGNSTLTTAGLGGRIVRIDPNGVVSIFAENFNTSDAIGSTSFVDSSLSITFSADGTTLYASDNDGVWQFKSVTSVAGATSGSLIGLNDLRTLAVPYDGSNASVQVLDTGIDGSIPNFRGRVANGRNLITNGFGNDDLVAGTTTGNNTGGNNNNTGTLLATTNGHGTLIAGVISQFVPQATLEPVNLFAPFIALGAGGNNQGGGGGGGGGGNNQGGTASNASTTANTVYNAFGYTVSHPFTRDPVRPGRTNRVVAAAIGFGTAATFDSEGSAYRFYPQIVISLKNQLRKFRKLGIAPIAATGQFGAPPGAGGNNQGGGGGGGGAGTATFGRNNAESADVGDVVGSSLPGVLNEVISVTGTYPFPYSASPSSLPLDTQSQIIPRIPGPILVFGNGTQPGGGNNQGGGNNNTTGNLGALSNGDFPYLTDRLLSSANRNVTTDFAAPAMDIPTFRRSIVGDGDQHLVFQEGGTSLSAGVVTGSYALVSSALNFWTELNKSGVTANAYLTQPVGSRTLNFGGPNAFKDLSAYNNPDGINAILAWTAVPATDPNDGIQAAQSPQALASENFRQFSRIDVGNAVAAIEGQIAVQWLLSRGVLSVIDSNQNGLITAQELQSYVDGALTNGTPEDGALARLLGGTARAGNSAGSLSDGTTAVFERPDQPDVLARRFNFFDYAADGQLNGVVSIDQFKLLAHNLLPLPDSAVVNDRQRASANGLLLAPVNQRNFKDLQHIQPKYQFVPKSALAKFKGISPARFRVQRNQTPSTLTAPVFTLFGGAKARAARARVASPTPAPTSGGSGSTTPANDQSIAVGEQTQGGTADQSKSIVAALQALAAKGVGNPGGTSLGTPTPAGTLAPVDGTMPTTVMPTTIVSDQKLTSTSGETTSDAADLAAQSGAVSNTAARKQQLANRRAARAKAARSRDKGFLGDAWDSVKKAFGG